VARKVVRQQEALRRARERRLAKHAAELTPDQDVVRQSTMRDPHTTDAERRRLVATACAWCKGPIEVKARGRLPKWCSAACRQRAWEQARATTSGRKAVEIVERRIEVPVPETPQQTQWVPMLSQLAAQLTYGGVYERNLDAIAPALEEAIDALRRRQAARAAR
jgi:hypothetical protein